MIEINLLPVREEKRTQLLRQQALIAVGALLIEFAVMCTVQSNRNSAVDEAIAREKESKEEKARLEKIIGDVEKYEKDKVALENKLDVINNLEKGRLTSVMLFDRIASLLPSRLFLTSIKQKGAQVKLEGKAIDMNVVAQFMDNLKRDDAFNGVDLGQTSLETVGSYKLMKFDLSAQVKFIEESEAAINKALGVDPKKKGAGRR